MFCPNCGAQNSDNSKYCTSCGTVLETSSGAQNEQQNQQDYAQQQGYNPFPPQNNGIGGYKVNIPFRNIAVAILLSIVTCGIYSIVWTIRLVDELNFASGRQNDTNGVTVWLLGLVTCSIYTLFWLYNAGEKVGEIRRRNGMEAGSDGVIYLVLALFGFSIVSYAMIQNELNKVAAIGGNQA